jgi:hypothetical protein
MTMLPADPDGAAIRAAFLADESATLRMRADEAAAAGVCAPAAAAQAAAWIEGVRARQSGGAGIEQFLTEYGLGTHEGVLLMCIAEALLRIPDAATADRLIRDKLSRGDWEKHLGGSSALVNASTWALMLTGKLTRMASDDERDPAAGYERLVARLGEPVVRVALRRAMKLMADEFVMGRAIGEALARARKPPHPNARHSFDMLGESAYTAADAKRYADAYSAAIAAIGASVDDHALPAWAQPSISVKLSALHPRYEISQAARVLGELGDPARIDAATAWFVAAERSADADAATRAAATLASWVLEQHADLDQGRTWLARAASEAQRAGSPPDLRAHVAIAEAALAWRERRGPDATRAAQQAVALARSAQDVELEALAASHLGVTLARQGRIAESIAVFDAQRSALEQRLGPAHPQLVPVLLNLGASLTTAGRHDEALSTFARARDLVEQRRGPEAPELARVEHNLAATELFREQPRRAAYHAARAVALSERSGVTLQIGALHHLGLAWVAIGRAAEAEAIAWRGAALVDEAFGAEHRFAADFLELAGDAAIARGEAGRGATLHARAFAIAQVLQPDPMRVAAMGTKVAVDRIVAGDDAGGVALLVAWLGRLEAGNPRLARAALTSLAQAYLRGGRPCAAAIYADRIVGGRDVGATTSLRAQAHAHSCVAPAHARALQQLAATQALDPDASAP